MDDGVSTGEECTLISNAANANYERGYALGGMQVGVFFETSFRMAYRHHQLSGLPRTKFDFVAVKTTSEEGFRRIIKRTLGGGGCHYYYIMMSPSYGMDFDHV